MFSVSLTKRMILNPRLALRSISSLMIFLVLDFMVEACESIFIAALMDFRGYGVPTSAGKYFDA